MVDLSKLLLLILDLIDVFSEVLSNGVIVLKLLGLQGGRGRQLRVLDDAHAHRQGVVVARLLRSRLTLLDQIEKELLERTQGSHTAVAPPIIQGPLSHLVREYVTVLHLRPDA